MTSALLMSQFIRMMLADHLRKLESKGKKWTKAIYYKDNHFQLPVRCIYGWEVEFSFPGS